MVTVGDPKVSETGVIQKRHGIAGWSSSTRASTTPELPATMSITARPTISFVGVREPHLTTTAVLYEAHALMLRIARGTASANVARAFLEEIEAGLARVIHVTRDDHRRAVGLVQAHQDKTYSLCDAVSFVVIERLRIKRAASFDQHSRQYARFEVFP